jgi:hypothetical protein
VLPEAGRWLIGLGLLLVLGGLALRLGVPLPPLGHLPGDIVIRRGGTVIWIPLATSLLLSLLLTLLAIALRRL